MFVKLNIQTLFLLTLILIFLSSSRSCLIYFSLFHCHPCIVALPSSLHHCFSPSLLLPLLALSIFILSSIVLAITLSFSPSSSFRALYFRSMAHSFSLPPIPAFYHHLLSGVSCSPHLTKNKPYLVLRR